MLDKYNELLNSLTLTDENREELMLIDDHLNRNELHIAILGKFSAGKSYLINALVGREKLLPTKVMETTAIVTEVRKAQNDSVVVEKLSGDVEIIDINQIQSYIHGNNGIESISKLTVSITNNQLPEEIVLIDTPGRNTIHNNHIRMSEEAILDAEAVVYVLSAAAVSKEDLLYLKHISQIQPNLFFVLNKIDKLFQDDEGEDLSTVVSRLENELSESLGIQATVYPVSAKEGIGIEDLREELFHSISDRFNELKVQAAEERFQKLVQNVKENLLNELHFIHTSMEKGVAGLEEERAKILSEKDKIQRLIENDRLGLINKWREIRKNKRNVLEQIKLRHKKNMLQELPKINSKIVAENLALQIQNDVMTTRKEFMDETITEMKEQSKHDLQLQIAEIEKNVSDIEISKPSLEILEQYQQEQLFKLAGEVESLQQKYHQLSEASSVESSDDTLLRELEDELITLKGKLDIPYIPQYVERERSDANFYQEMLKGVGQVADVAVMLIPFVGPAKTGATVAANGAKVAIKEGTKQASKQMVKEGIKAAAKEGVEAATKEFAKSAAKTAGKKVAEKTAEELMKEKALKALKLLSFEGLGEKVGSSIDRNRETSYQIEDEEYRRTFFLKQQEIQTAYVRKERELKRLFQEQEKVQKQAKLQVEQKRKLEALKIEKEKEIAALRESQAKESKQTFVDSLQAITEEEIASYINKQLEALENWLTAQSFQIEQAVSSGLQAYYQEQFEKIEQQLLQVEQSYRDHHDLLTDQKSKLEQQIHDCDEVLGVLIS